jgi:hypothetical protein
LVFFGYTDGWKGCFIIGAAFSLVSLNARICELNLPILPIIAKPSFIAYLCQH